MGLMFHGVSARECGAVTAALQRNGLSVRFLLGNSQRCRFANEIVQFAGHSSELMRDAIRYNNHLAFSYLMFLPALNFGAADFVRRDFLRINRLSTGDERG